MATGTWQTPPAYPGPAEVLPELDVPAPDRQRRLTVLLRWLLLIPQFVVVWALSLLAFAAVVVGWFGALALGRLPEPIERYLAGFVRYDTRVRASAMLLVDRYPPFAWSPEDYPVRVELKPGPLNRLAVLFRLILMIPAAIVESLLTGGWYVAAFVIWIIVLVLGRMPEPLFGSSAAVLRFTTRFSAYVLMLTAAYPKRVFGDDGVPPVGPAVSATRPLLLTAGAKALVVVFLVLGLGSSMAGSFSSSDHDNGYSARLRGRAVTATARATQASAATEANPLTAGSRP
ncbi:DUF4389 domain-containing protein [Kitasatospora sp. NPDC059571]|uniref:DUF4389 domain-containing protein n=1 Tax=Kitasatospora sp. NPDC059571 TaxID=3346871 RepID=UPI00367890D4